MRCRRPFFALLGAEGISLAGTTMTLLAVPWFVLVTTGSAARTGVAAACETVPLVLASGLGGPLVDRVGARRTSVLSDLLSAAGLLVIPVLHATSGLAFWQLCLAVAFVGLVRAPGETARSVLVPSLIVLSGMPVERGTSAYDGVSRGARMLGAPVAGGLIALLGPANVLALDALTFLVSAAIIATSVPQPADVEPASSEPYLAQLRAGLRGVRADRLLLGIVVMVMVTNLLDAAWATVLMPVYARDVLHSSVALGVVFAAFGLGAVLGTVLYGALGPRLPRWPVFTLAFLLLGLPRFALLAAEPALVVILVGSLAFGVLAGSLNPLLAAVEYERISPALRSRVFGILAAGSLAGTPVGAVLGGVAVEHLGLTTALLVFGGAYLLATLPPAVLPVWRQLDATRGTLDTADLSPATA